MKCIEESNVPERSEKYRVELFQRGRGREDRFKDHVIKDSLIPYHTVEYSSLINPQLSSTILTFA